MKFVLWNIINYQHVSIAFVIFIIIVVFIIIIIIIIIIRVALQEY